jgi:hypothetical protein
MRAHARACLRQTTVSIGAAAIVPTAPPTVRSHPLFHPRASGLISLCVLREVGFPSSPSHHSATPIGRSTVRLAVDESSLISLTQAPSQGALPPRVKLRHLVKLRWAPCLHLHHRVSCVERLHADEPLRPPSDPVGAINTFVAVLCCSPTPKPPPSPTGHPSSPPIPFDRCTPLRAAMLMSPQPPQLLQSPPWLWCHPSPRPPPTLLLVTTGFGRPPPSRAIGAPPLFSAVGCQLELAGPAKGGPKGTVPFIIFL